MTVEEGDWEGANKKVTGDECVIDNSSLLSAAWTTVALTVYTSASVFSVSEKYMVRM